MGSRSVNRREESAIIRLAPVTQLTTRTSRVGGLPVTLTPAQARGVPRSLAVALNVLPSDRD
jgi:hypothetical protein